MSQLAITTRITRSRATLLRSCAPALLRSYAPTTCCSDVNPDILLANHTPPAAKRATGETSGKLGESTADGRALGDHAVVASAAATKAQSPAAREPRCPLATFYAAKVFVIELDIVSTRDHDKNHTLSRDAHSEPRLTDCCAPTLP